MQPEPGAMLGRYRLERPVGRGGMGVVWRALDTELHRPVAIKLLAPQLAFAPDFVERFRREARLAAGLRHPNIVAIHDWGTQDEQPFIVMELLEGRSLKQLIQDSGPLPLARAIRLIVQCADALQFAHDRGVVHRDVKPGNVMVEPNGRAVLTDFGVARAATGEGLTSSGGIIGTPEYLSPEQAMGRPVDGRSDLYSLGVVLYELLSGRTPFAADSTPAILHLQVYSPPPSLAGLRPDVPPRVLNAIERAMSKDPAERFAGVGQFGQALTAALAGAPPPAPTLDPAAGTLNFPPSGSTASAPTADALHVGQPAGPSAGTERPVWQLVTVGVLVLGALVFTARFGLGIGAPKSEPTPTPRAAAAVTPVLSPAASPALVAASPIAPPAAASPSPPAAVAAASPPAAASPAPPVDPAVALVREGDGIALQDLSGAAAKYRQALARDPNSALANRQLGLALYYQNRVEEATKALELSTRLDPKDPIAWAFLGAAYYDDARYERIGPAVAQAVQLAPDAPETHAALAVQRLADLDLAMARIEVEEALKRNPDSPLAQFAYTSILWRVDDREGAQAVAQGLVNRRERWASTHLLLASVYYARGRTAQARPEVERALSLDPQTFGAYGNLGDVLRDEKKPDEAAQAYRTELQQNPRHVNSVTGLAWLAFDRKDFQAALDGFRAATEIDPRSEWAWAAICRTLDYGFQRYLEAEANCRKALSINPRFDEGHFMLGVTLYNRQRYVDALDSFKTAASIDGQVAAYWGWAAAALRELGRLQESRQYYEQALAIDPNDPDLWRALDDVKRRGG